MLDAILTAFRTHNREVCAVALQLERKKPQISEKLSENEHEISRIRTQLAQTVRFKKSLYESLASGDITADEYTEMKAEYARDIDRLRERADTLERERQEFERCNDENYGIYEQLCGVTVRGDITAELIDTLIEKILVSHDKSVNVVLKAVAEYAEAA